jgi:IS605 OrfB family transposase
MEEARLKGARLVKKDNEYFLNLVLEKEVNLPRWEECETIIGVDIGINYIAVCSALTKDGKFTNPLFFKGGEWKHLCDRKRKITRSKEFKKITRRQNEILHIVSKKVVEYAKQFPKPIIIMEKLGYFKNNSKNKRWKFLLGNWARKKLQFMIEYKAKWEGIPVIYVNPAYTSLTCHYCGVEGIRKGLVFKCLNCGREYNADANASMNLARKFRQILDRQLYIRPKNNCLMYEGSRACLYCWASRWGRIYWHQKSILERMSPLKTYCSDYKLKQRNHRVDKQFYESVSGCWIYRSSKRRGGNKRQIYIQTRGNEKHQTILTNDITISENQEEAGGVSIRVYFNKREKRVDKTILRRRISHLQSIERNYTQSLDEPKAMIGGCSPEDLSSSGEGETCLPMQTQIRPRNGRQMNRMMVIRTVSLPIGIGRC